MVEGFYPMGRTISSAKGDSAGSADHEKPCDFCVLQITDELLRTTGGRWHGLRPFREVYGIRQKQIPRFGNPKRGDGKTRATTARKVQLLRIDYLRQHRRRTGVEVGVALILCGNAVRSVS
jgi:hypothetical protein